MAENKAVERSDSVEALLKQLKNPFEAKFVKVRVGATNKDKTKGIALFYLDSREVMKRLDEVCGLDGWASDKEAVTAGDKLVGVKCSLSIRMPYCDARGIEKWVTRSDYGEPSMASPLKGASSDALKRAAVNFGIGRYLYYIPNQWYELDKYKQFKQTPELPTWALPQQGLEDWEDVAILEYDPTKDVDLEGVDFEDEEARKVLTEAKSRREEIIEAAKAKAKK